MALKDETRAKTEQRKYTQKEIDSLGAEGKAFKNPDSSFSYPIANVSDLKNAIRAVGRSNSSHNAVRKFIAKRAKALGQTDLLPDSWASDGSISQSNGGYWTDEMRDTANDTFIALQGAVGDALEGEFSSWSVYVMDWTGTPDGGDSTNDYIVIYQAGGDVYACEFDYDADMKLVLDLDTAEKVRPVTQYIPRSERAADDPCPTCGGSGKIKGDSTECPDCGGSGEASDQSNAARSLTPNTVEWRRSKAPRKGDKEHRTFTLDNVELRDDEGEDGTLSLRGYASVTGVDYNVGPYVERIQQGAFKRTLGLADLDVTLLVNHADLPIARTTNGTLRLSEDSHGLLVDADLDPADPDVQRVERKLRSGLLTEMSFAFRVSDQDWSSDYGERLIKEVSLHRGDVSIVTNGASPTTEVALRSERLNIELRNYGPEAVIEMMVEYARFIYQSLDERAGKALSDASMSVLTRVLSLASGADDNLDELQPLLADLMNVPNPDADDKTPVTDDTEEQNAAPAPGESTSMPEFHVTYNRSAEVRARLLLLEEARKRGRGAVRSNVQSSSLGHRADA